MSMKKIYHHGNLREKQLPKIAPFFKFEPTYLSTYQQHLFLATVLPTTHCKEKQTAIVLRSQSSPLLLLFQIDATIIFSEC